MTHTTPHPEAKDDTPLARMNDNPPEPPEPDQESEEHDGDGTPLARMNDNPPRTDDEAH